MALPAVGLIMGTRLWYAMWDAKEDDDAAFESRANPMLREIGDRCKVVAVEARQQPHEPTPAPSPAPTRQVAQAQTPGVGAPRSSTSSSHSHQQGEKTAAKGSRAVTTVQQLMPSTASSTTSGSFAEMAAFIREERALRESQRQEWEAKLEAQRQAYETKLEAQRQETERQDAKMKMCVSNAQLEGLQERFDALHQAKLLTDDEVLVLENKIADFIDRRSSAMVAPADIGVVAESVRKLVGMCEGVSRDGMLARQLRQRYL